MKINDVRTLVENNKTEESIDLLKTASVGLLNSFTDTVNLLMSRIKLFRQHQIDGTMQTENLNNIHMAILQLAQEMVDFAPPEDIIVELIESKLLIRNSFPFIDRKKFRRSIKRKLTADEAHIFLVKGEPKSGMSHLGKYLRHLSDKLKVITLITCDIPQILDEPHMHLGEKLAKYMSFSMDMEVNFDENENAQFKFVQFITKLKDKISSENKVPVFFMHDFHKINDRNENLLEFVLKLITSINGDFPKAIFILAGLNFENLRNWHDDLRFTTEIYTMEAANLDDLKNCLSIIYKEYQEEIQDILNQPMTEEEYLEEMVNTLVEDENNLNIQSIGESLSNHLFTLKS